MKKVFLILLAIVILGGMSVQSATLNPEYRLSIKKKPKDRDLHRHYDNRYYGTNADFQKSIRKEKEREIEYRLDILEAKYNRDKNRLDNSYMDKYDKKVREKELKYQYTREKDRLKNEKKRLKNESFYAN